MLSTITSNEEYELTKDDCIEWLQVPLAITCFHLRIDDGQRIGQAWVNTLDKDDYEKITGSFVDPFHADDWPAVIRALRFLLEN